LRPDDTVLGGDQFIFVDPSGTNRIYVRAGGTRDNSDSQLYLGGENSHFSVGAGTNPPLYLKADGHQWTFGTDGVLYVPGRVSLAGNMQGTTTTDSTPPTNIMLAAGDNTSTDPASSYRGANLTLRGGSSQEDLGGSVYVRAGTGTANGTVDIGDADTLEVNIGATNTPVTVLGNLDVDGITNLGNIGNVKITGGTSGQTLTTDGTGNLTWATGGGGTTNPAGANTEVQFNDDGVFGADAAFTFDKATGLMSVQDLLVTGNVTGALLPDANITYDLGSTTQRWKDLYLSNNTIYMGDQTISANATHLNLVAGANTWSFSEDSFTSPDGAVTISKNGFIESTSVLALKGDVEAAISTDSGDGNLSTVSTNLTDGVRLITQKDSGTQNILLFDRDGNLTVPFDVNAANVNANNFNAALGGALTFPQNTTRISENVLGAQVEVEVPTQTVTGTGTGATLRVRYTPGSASYTRADGRGNGTGYVNGDQVLVLGSLLGGTDGDNDLTVELTTVDGAGIVDFGSETIVSGTPIAGPAGMNIETDGDNWSFANRTFTVPGDIQNDGQNDFEIICNDPEDDGLVMALKFNLEGAITSSIQLEGDQVDVNADGEVRIRTKDSNGGDDHGWAFTGTGTMLLIGDTGDIETNDDDLNLISSKSSTLASGYDASLISQWNGQGGGKVQWTKATVGYQDITMTTNMGRSATEYQWTFTQTGILQLPEYNNEQSSLIGTRNTITTTASPITAPVGTPTTIYTPTTDVYSYKAIVTIKHDMGGSTEVETFEVMASKGAESTVFSVSSRLNTHGSNGGLNDATVTTGAGFELIIDAKYGTTNTVTFAVTEFN
jgi:hypothetical protein